MRKKCFITVHGKRIFNAAGDSIFREIDSKSAEISEEIRNGLDGGESEETLGELQGLIDLFSNPVVLTPETCLSTYGVIDDRDGNINIRYRETEVSGGEGITVFTLLSTGALTLCKEGQEENCMIFENEKRILCDYGSIGGVAVAIYTRELSADITAENGGKIILDYFVEVNGQKSEHNRFEVKVNTYKRL